MRKNKAEERRILKKSLKTQRKLKVKNKLERETGAQILEESITTGKQMTLDAMRD